MTKAVKPLFLAVPAAVAVLAAAGCGGSTTVSVPTVAPVANYTLSDFKTSKPLVAGKPVKVSFTILQPDGKPMLHFKTGPGPHTGVHLIMVRNDLAYMIHVHPPVGKPVISTVVTFPKPGPYRIVVDVYPAAESQSVNANFQLFGKLVVPGKYTPEPLPPTSQTEVVDGYHVSLHGAENLKAIDAQLVVATVIGPDGKPAHFTPWYGALAHAIFFHKGQFAYFHTHVCAAGITGCTSILGPQKITGSSTKPGVLKVGVLVPEAGTWRLFLQMKPGPKVVTVPFTLHVH
jgi:hypothetical protein